MEIKINLLYPNSKIPRKAHQTDACYDVYAVSKHDYGDGRVEYGLGFSLELQGHLQADFRARSSIHETGMILSNCIGTGDAGYRGEYKAVFYKIIKDLPDYEVGDRILQMQVPGITHDLEFICVDFFSDSDRGSGSYGSSGK